MAGIWRIRQVARAVRAGGVIAYPTEAVWGLGCDPWNAAAVMRLLALKNRPVAKGLILVAADITQFDDLLSPLPNLWRERLAASWPGPNTWLVPHRGRLPEWISGGRPKVALRVSDHPLVRQLCAGPVRWSPPRPIWAGALPRAVACASSSISTAGWRRSSMAPWVAGATPA